MDFAVCLLSADIQSIELYFQDLLKQLRFNLSLSKV